MPSTFPINTWNGGGHSNTVGHTYSYTHIYIYMYIDLYTRRMQDMIIAHFICIYVKWSWRYRSLYMHMCICIHQVEAKSHPRIHLNKHAEWR